ncbi:TetR/AcrR family transcriptional regulator [Tsukamurella ocularis]|uniref:TetR/AcrR family transcriptional regulator n=1 Tax=Tsukamurella ocularis TaxID=1970234 RepID=UPI0039F0BAE6
MSRAEQKELTREKLLDATITSLVTHGYAGTTTQRIQEAAGVSRGALLHHFGSKSELLVAAIHHVADARLRQMAGLSAEFADSTDPLRDMVAAIRSAMTGPHFQAALELWSASRTDAQLAAALLPAERRLGAELRGIFAEYSGIADPTARALAFESLMALVRGLEVTRHLRDDGSIADAVIENWMISVRPDRP